MPVQLMEWMHVPLMLKSTQEVLFRRAKWVIFSRLTRQCSKEGYMRIAAATSNIYKSCPYQYDGQSGSGRYEKKEGAAYDLPIAIGMLAASGYITTDILDKYIILGGYH